MRGKEVLCVAAVTLAVARVGWGATGAFSSATIKANGSQAVITFSEPAGGGSDDWFAVGATCPDFADEACDYTEDEAARPVFTVTSEGFGPATGVSTDGTDGYLTLELADDYLEDLRGDAFAWIMIVKPTDVGSSARVWSSEGGDDTDSPVLRDHPSENNTLTFFWDGGVGGLTLDFDHADDGSVHSLAGRGDRRHGRQGGVGLFRRHAECHGQQLGHAGPADLE